MGFFSRLSNGWRMGMLSLNVIKKNKQLVLFPIISGAFLLLVIGSFAGLAFANWGLEVDQMVEEATVTEYAITFIFYLLSYFVIVFFNVGLVHCTRMYLMGESPTVGDGIRYSMSRLPIILGWAVLSATVGLVLKAIQENAGTVGEILSGLLGMVWSIVTFFVVPVLAYENTGPLAALKRSGKIMKEKWGESIGASFSFGIISFVGFLIIALPIGFLIGMIHPIAGIAAGVFAAFLIQSIVSSAEMVFITSVYHQIVQNEPVEDFDPEVLDNLFVEKKKKGLFG